MAQYHQSSGMLRCDVCDRIINLEYEGYYTCNENCDQDFCVECAEVLQDAVNQQQSPVVITLKLNRGWQAPNVGNIWDELVKV